MGELMTTIDLGVKGMTCGHCVHAVTEELQAIGASQVDVDLQQGGVSTVTVTSADPLPQDAIAAAIDEAGYELA